MSSPIVNASFASSASASASASADSARSLSPATTPATVDEDSNHPKAHEYNHDRSESPSWSNLSPSVVDVLETYDALACGLPLPLHHQRSVAGSEPDSRILVWTDFSPKDYAVLQSVLTAACPPLDWTAAANFHRTKAREEYYANTLRLRMPSSLHDTTAGEVAKSLIQSLKTTLAAHPAENGSWEVEKAASAEIVFCKCVTKRSPDGAISVKRRKVAISDEDEEENEQDDGQDTNGEEAEDEVESPDEGEGEGESLPGTTPSPTPPAAEDIFPPVVIEVGFSNQAEQDHGSLEDYIELSDGHIRTVIYLEIEYEEPAKRSERHRKGLKRRNPIPPPTTLSLKRLAPDSQNPASEDEITSFDDVLFPEPASRHRHLPLALSNFLPSTPEPDSIVRVPYASLRTAVQKAWKEQMWRDLKMFPEDRGRRINSSKRKREAAEAAEAQVMVATTVPVVAYAHQDVGNNQGSSRSGMQTRSSGKRARIDIAR